MRMVSIVYNENGFKITDSDEEWVEVIFENNIAKVISFLTGDDEPVIEEHATTDAMNQALGLMGVID